MADNNRRPSQNQTVPNEPYAPPAFIESSTSVISPSALEAQERAVIDIQIATARAYPRSLEAVRKRILMYATLDEETAESCFYTLKRKQDGGVKFIDGPSIRLAEIALVCYGNIRGAARVTANDGRKITSQGVCMDLETNVAVSMEVQRRITTSEGWTFSEDMQVTTGNAANAIALRNTVFKVIPMALIKPIYRQIRDFATGEGKPMAERWSKAVQKFRIYGAEPEQLLRWLDKPNATKVTEEDLGRLIGLFGALKEGETTIEKEFAEEPLPADTDPGLGADTTTPQKEAGPFTRADFSAEEFASMTKMWKSANRGTVAQLEAYLSKWTADRSDLMTQLREGAEGNRR